MSESLVAALAPLLARASTFLQANPELRNEVVTVARAIAAWAELLSPTPGLTTTPPATVSPPPVEAPALPRDSVLDQAVLPVPIAARMPVVLPPVPTPAPVGEHGREFVPLPLTTVAARCRLKSAAAKIMSRKAAGATDTGHAGGSASFALDANGKLDWQAIRNFAHVGIHEMTVTGKALTQALYGVAPRYSYFTGCSTGGRQGLMEAQRYPQDYDGIAAAAPAINWTSLLVQSLWGDGLEGRGIVAWCVYGAASIAVAALLHYAVERPFLKLRGKLLAPA